MTQTAPHILVIDDDARLRDLLSRFLQESGYLVSGAESAAHVFHRRIYRRRGGFSIGRYREGGAAGRTRVDGTGDRKIDRCEEPAHDFLGQGGPQCH